MASAWYDSGFEGILDGSIDWAADDIRVLLVTTAYTFSAVHDFVNDVTAQEVTGAGYSRQALVNESETFDAGTRQYRFDADDVVWASIEDDTAESCDAAIIFKQVTDDTDSILIAYVEDPSAITFNDGQVTLTFDATGVFRFDA